MLKIEPAHFSHLIHKKLLFWPVGNVAICLPVVYSWVFMDPMSGQAAKTWRHFACSNENCIEITETYWGRELFLLKGGSWKCEKTSQNPNMH